MGILTLDLCVLSVGGKGRLVVKTVEDTGCESRIAKDLQQEPVNAPFIHHGDVGTHIDSLCRGHDAKSLGVRSGEDKCRTRK